MEPNLDIKQWMDYVVGKGNIRIPLHLQRELMQRAEILVNNEIRQFRQTITDTFRLDKGENSIESIFKAVLNEFDVTPDEIFSVSRRKHIVIPRHLIRWMLHNRYSGSRFTLWQIAQLTKKNARHNDHATVLNSIKVVDNLIETDADFRLRLENIIDNLKQNRTLNKVS